MKTKIQIIQMMKIKESTKSALTLVLFICIWWSCKKDKDLVAVPQPILNSPELITSMVLMFTDSANVSDLIKAEFRDPDGPGGNSATKFDTIKLKPNKTYLLNLILIDETKMPFDTISNEIAKEKNDHQFFFSHTGLNLSTSYLDKDGNGLPVGLLTKWRTSNASIGSSKITLKHQVGIKNGTIAAGDTDAEVIYQTKIQ
jgi:hypothetical protein